MRFLILTLTVLLSSFLFAQQPPVKAVGSIDGQVFDSVSRQPLEYVSIRVCRVADTSVVSGIYTDENGKFVLDQLPAGTFIVRISQTGFNDKFIPGIRLTAEKPLRKLGAISLASDSDALEEVVIEGKKDILEMGIDKKVYNVGEDISVQGGSANDVLNNVPSVEIDQDGKVSLRGDGNVTILIDGRPSSLSGGNGKSLLDGIPAGSIERIEIVTNPSAKYDPDGTSGIINIVLKKNIKRGVNGLVTLSGATGNAYNESVSLNMRNTRFNLFGNFANDYKEGYRNNFSDLRQTYGADSVVNLRQRRRGTDLNKSNTAKIGMDIYLKDRNTVSWNLSGNMGVRDRSGDQTNFRYRGDTDTIGFWNRSSYEPGTNQNLDASVNYNWEFKEDKGTVDWNVYQSLGNSTNQGYYYQSYDIPIDTVVQDQQLFNTEKNNITTASMDIVRIFKKKWRTESGFKMIHRDMGVDTHSQSRNNTSNDYQSDTLAYFTYQYTERIYSAYGIIAGGFKKIKFQAGLRFEESYQEPNLVSKNQSYLNRYFNIFPSGHARYSLSKIAELSLGYSKRINRPSADNLNPFTSYADPYNLRKGNPALRPEYIHSIDLGFELTGKKWSLTASLYQRFSSSVIQRVKVFYPNGTSAGTFANIASSRSTGGELIVVARPTSFWKNTLSATGNYIVYKDNSTTVNYNRQGFVFGMKFSSSIDLWKKTLTLQINSRYSAPSVTPQGIMNPRGSVDFSAEKTFKDGKWGIGTRITDIFNTQGFNFEVDQAAIYQYSSFKWQTRRVYLSLRYKFGKTDFNDKKKPADQPAGGGGGFDF